MQCTRCAGLRVPETIYEGGNRIQALRCIHCGDVSDHVIVLNQGEPERPSTEAIGGRKIAPRWLNNDGASPVHLVDWFIW